MENLWTRTERLRMRNRIIQILLLLCCLPIQTGCIGEDDYADDPVGNFEQLWKIIDERYCFLDSKGIDWDAVHEKYSKLIVPGMSNDDLFDKLSEMLYILKDGQGYLVDDASKMAVKGEVPTVSTSEVVSADEGEAQEIPCTVTTVNVNGQDCEALSYTVTDADGQTATVSYCLVGDDLKYVVTDAAEGRTIVEYRVTSTTVDQNLFNIPADYQILTQAEFEAAQANH